MKKDELFKSNLQHLNFESELHQKIIETHEQYRKYTKEYVNQIIITVGVVAGFGFTSLDHVIHIELFLLGEFYLFLAISLAFYFIKKYWVKPLEDLNEWHIKLKELLILRTSLNLNDSDQVTLNKYNLANDKAKELAVTTDDSPNDKIDYIRIIIILFIVGGLSIILSLADFINYIA